MKKSSVSNEDLGQDIAVILNTVKNIDCAITEMKGRTEKNETRIGTLEVNFSALKERTSNLAIFQSVFSAIIGAVALALSQLIK